MNKKRPGLVTERREEIINACEKLYRTMSFREITLKEIGNEVPFSRPTIYNYFETKEEIFLALFEREYRTWTKDLAAIVPTNGAKDVDAVAEEIARSLDKRTLMLRLLSSNLYDMEANSRMEELVAFKKAYRECLQALYDIISALSPDAGEEQRRQTLTAILEFIYGLYPYAFATDKQIEAMTKAGLVYNQKSIYELSLFGLKKLLR